jgi:Rrf2 family protein
VDLPRIVFATTIVTIMANNVQFSIAVHLMAGLACKVDEGMKSSDLAQSVNTSPSFVRRTLSKLSKAGLVETVTGKAGACWLAKDAKEISLLDIYRAVDAPKVFAIHNYAEQNVCFVSCNIKTALEKVLVHTQKAMEERLSEISLAKIVSDVQKR